MALLGREFIAVPDDRKGQIVFKWHDNNLRRFSRAIVDVDELALFVNQGQVVGTLPPGQHQIDANELPFLGAIIDRVTGGNAYRAELFFVGTKEYTGQPFGGRIDDVQDPQTGMIVTLRVFGDYALKVVDPGKLVLNLTGTVDVTDNEAITAWIAEQLLKVMRTDVTTQIVRNGWPILGLSAFTPDIEKSVIAAGNGQIEPYGLSIVRMGNFDINLSDDDETTLKGLAKDTAYSRLAGGFQQYAAGEALLGAGEGMAKGGGGTGPAFIAAGLGIGQQMTAPPTSTPPPPGPGFAGGGPGFAGPSAPAGVTCTKCGTTNAAGAKFCAACGTALAPPAPVCAACGAANPAGAKFCASCGAVLAPAALHCTQCGTEMAAGTRFCPNCGTAAPAPAAGAGPGGPPSGQGGGEGDSAGEGSGAPSPAPGA